jgi:hypothetical protein
MKTNVFVRVAVSVALVASVAACALPGETPEQFNARMDSAIAGLNTIAAQMQAETDRRNAAVQANRMSITTCSQSGMYYNCLTY